MTDLDLKIPTNAELYEIRLQAEDMRRQVMGEYLRQAAALVAAIPRALFSAPSCARPLRHH